MRIAPTPKLALLRSAGLALIVRFLVLLMACGTPVTAPAPIATPPPKPIAAIASVAPPVASAPIWSLPPKRRGQCQLRDALTEYIGAESPVHCGDLPASAWSEEDERVRACILTAAHAHKSFVATIQLPGIDSHFEQAYAGRNKGAAYEVRSFSYDSCPEGCGDDDPVWESHVCESLVDMRSACPKRKRMDADDALREPCLEASEGGNKRRLEIWCNRPVAADRCPTPSPDPN